MVKHIFSTEGNCWKQADIAIDANVVASDDILELTGETKQTILGFGGCFNELGFDCIKRLSKEDQDKLFDELFKDENCAFNYGRIPIGANDFSLEWYSCDEVDGDYELEHFNIDRDKEYTIPFINEAKKRCAHLELFASPWSPPIWMKTKKAYNYGNMRMEDKVLKAYANYFVKFVKAYQEQGLKITQVHPQNEPFADQKFPSCVWLGDDMKVFIAKYLGPAFEQAGMDTEIWLGTINGPFNDYRGIGGGSPAYEFFDQWANNILSDKEARKYLSGVGLQWGGKHIAEQVHLAYPELKIMQTESECGDGENSWEQMEYIFSLMWHYFRHGAERYMYWNIALEDGISSTWGWSQNSLVTVDADNKLKYQPEFYLMKHFSHFVKSGAKYLSTKGHWAANSCAFENEDGSIAIIVGNGMDRDREFTFKHGDIVFNAIIKAHSINSFLIEK